jgi:hypothetical protein
MRRVVSFAFWVSAVLLLPARALACAVCVDGTKPDFGFLWSALFLMAVPLVMAGVIGGFFYSAARRARRNDKEDTQ